ncbi:MAG: hypothetical protein WCK81_03855 [Betaproteobacteria bacterium]
MRQRPLRTPWSRLAMAVLAVLACTAVLAEDTKPTKPFKIIDAECEATASESSATGLFVCQYTCNDTDHTKVSVVYNTSGSGQCRTPIKKKIKQYIK